MSLLQRGAEAARRLYQRQTPAERAWAALRRRLRTWNLVHGRMVTFYDNHIL